MTAVNTKFGLWPTYPNRAIANTAILCDAAGERQAMGFKAPKAGDINRILFAVDSLVTGPHTIRASLQLPSGNVPDGTPLASGTVSVTASGVYEVTFGTPYTATRGQYLMAVVEFDSYTAGSISYGSGNLEEISSTFHLHFTAAWANTGRTPCIAVGYTDGYEPILGHIPALINGNNLWANNVANGNRFRLPFPATLYGVVANMRGITGSQAKLYSDAGTLLASSGVRVAGEWSGSQGPHEYTFDPVNIPANTYYRLVIEGTTATNVQGISYDTNANGMSAMPGGAANMYATSRSSAGVWTDNTLARYSHSLVLSALDDGAGGGGGSGAVYVTSIGL